MKLFLASLLAVTATVVCAQTNTPAAKGHSQQIEITSDSAQYEGLTNLVVFLGHVLVTDNTNKLTCDRLTVSLPENGSHLTNVVAESNVEIEYLDKDGQANYLTADKAVYAYSVVTNQMTITTNKIVTFTRADPGVRIRTPSGTNFCQPLIYDMMTKSWNMGHFKGKYELKSSGTNSSPLDFLK